MEYDIEALIGIAMEAGRAVMTFYRRGGNYELKADGSPLTAADRASHEIITEGLHRLGDEIPVLSEEGRTISYDERSRWESFWLVDPLDGTKEFIKGNGEFTVNIALIEAGRPVAGVVYAPALGELYYATEGQGAFKRSVPAGAGSRQAVEGRALRVRGGGKDSLTVVRSRSHASQEEERFLSQFRIGQSIAVGSSLKFCLVAEGKADLYHRHGHTWEWDTAAGHAVAEAAGAYVYGLRYGKENLLNDGFLCASFDVASAYEMPGGIESRDTRGR